MLQKFLDCSVIEDCRQGKENEKGRAKGCDKFEDSHHRLYRFVMSPGALNFLEDETTSDNGEKETDHSLCRAHSFALKGGISFC